MLIDWFTVGAQTLNFLILVWLMKRFLYRPILDAIDAREKRIAAQIADADATKAQAQQERDGFLQKNETFDRERAALLAKATEEANARRECLLGQARADADALSSKRAESLASEGEHLNSTIRRRAQDEVFAIARKTLGDLADTGLEKRMGDLFVGRIRAMDDATKAEFADALKTNPSDPAILRSAFELPPEQRAAIQQALDETFPAGVELRFETAPDIVSGIELTSHGQKIAWSIADYLASLEKSVGDLLKTPTAPASAS